MPARRWWWRPWCWLAGHDIGMYWIESEHDYRDICSRCGATLDR